MERRINLDRRSNWRDALEKLHATDLLLKELDDILSDLHDEGAFHEEEKLEFDQSEFYWADRIKAAVNKYKNSFMKGTNK